MRRRILLGLAIGVGCVVAVTTTASGAGPGPGLSQGWDGLTRGNERYVTVPAGASTSIQVINRNGGRVLRFMSIKGTWGIPLVAYDGTTAGFLPDGRTLLLAQPVYSGQGLRNGWAYTLYGASQARPFIHALDTRHVSAVCIDLPWKTSPDHIFDYRLRTDGDGHLVVRGPRGRALIVVDRHSFRVLSAVRSP